MINRFFLTLFLLLTAASFGWAVTIDGTNDFTAEDIVYTTTTGYTNWIQWSATDIFIGVWGDDVDAGNSNVSYLLYVAKASNTGIAYGDSIGTSRRRMVLPLQFDYLVRYVTTNAFLSASANADSVTWNWNDPLTFTDGTDFKQIGNYLEFRITKTALGDPTYLALFSHFLKADNTYAGLLSGTFSDDMNANPSNYVNFYGNVWDSTKKATNQSFWTNDTEKPYTNDMLSPLNFQSNYVGDTVSLTNFARDENGIYKVEVYTNANALYDTVWISNTNAFFYYDIVTTNFGEGTYHFYTLAYDTRNILSSGTNTNVTLILSSDIIIHKEISSIQLPDIDLLIPGALITYKVTFTNEGPLTASNIVIYDKIPDNTKYITNYLGTASGWTAQYAHIPNPDQSYNSTDYDSITNTNVTWFRWKKIEVTTNESGQNMYLGVMVK